MREQPPVDVVLKICHEVFKLEHLHLGWWEPDEAPIYGNCNRAGDRFLEKLLANIPEGVRSVADVGCGLGAGSRRLHAEGYRVEAINPDPYQAGIFRQRNDQIPFHQCTLQDFVVEEPFDLALSSESSQYIPLPDLFGGFKRLVGDSGPGWVLLTDWFIKPEGTWVRGHREDDFRRAAEQGGFVIDREQDITEHVLPTLTCLRDFLTGYAVPAVSCIEDLAAMHMPWRTRILKAFLGRRVSQFHRFLREDLPTHFDPEGFRRNVRYLTFLMKRR